LKLKRSEDQRERSWEVEKLGSWEDGKPLPAAGKLGGWDFGKPRESKIQKIATRIIGKPHSIPAFYL
jgi:hypothetical protein